MGFSSGCYVEERDIKSGTPAGCLNKIVGPVSAINQQRDLRPWVKGLGGHVSNGELEIMGQRIGVLAATQIDKIARYFVRESNEMGFLIVLQHRGRSHSLMYRQDDAVFIRGDGNRVGHGTFQTRQVCHAELRAF